MFKKKKRIESRFITRDSNGEMELWIKQPTFFNLGDGAGCFLDHKEPENQISLDSPFNRGLVNQFLLEDNTCLELKLEWTKNGVRYRLVRNYSYKVTSY